MPIAPSLPSNHISYSQLVIREILPLWLMQIKTFFPCKIWVLILIPQEKKCSVSPSAAISGLLFLTISYIKFFPVSSFYVESLIVLIWQYNLNIPFVLA